MNQAASLPAGFNMTELGLLPEEWEAKPLSAFINERKLKNKSLSELPVFTISNIYGFIRSDDYFDKQVYSRDLSTYKLVNCSDFAYNPYRINVGSLGLFENEDTGLVSSAYIVFNISDPSLLDTKYLKLLLKSDSYINMIMNLSMSRGSVRRSLSYSDLTKLVIPCPPLTEQRAIAHILSTIQRAIEAQDKVISAARELKKSLMRHLFTYGLVPVNEVDQVELKETDIGSIRDKWQVMQLEEALTEAQYGLSIRGATIGQFPILRMNNLFNGKITTSNMQYVDLDDRELSKFKLNKGDILFNRTNSYELVGKTSLFDLTGTYVFASYLIRMAVNRAVLYAPYLNYYLNTYQGQLSLKAVASRAVSQSNISASKLRSLRIPVPTLNEQRSISDILVAVDNKLVFEENRKSALQTLFKTMLHLLMTGQLRVKDLRIEN